MGYKRKEDGSPRAIEDATKKTPEGSLVRTMDRPPRHITFSNERGLVAELEVASTECGATRYIVRCYRVGNSNPVTVGIRASEAELWTGFQYSDTQWSFIKFADKPGTAK